MLGLFLLVLCTGLQLNSATAFKITGAGGGIDARTGTLPSRTEISSFAKSGAAFDLFVLAIQRLQSIDQADQLSYFQVAGIHGYPSIPWDGVIGNGQGNFAGYCLHSSVGFPLWHRPYLALFEQLVWTHAKDIAATYPPEQVEQYQQAALTLRIPYWDWVIQPELPEVYTSPNVFINGPSGWHQIKNPLYQYNFHPVPDGNGWPVGVFLSNVGSTLRYPDADFIKSNNTRASEEMKAASVQRLQATYQLLTSVTDYTTFSSTQPNGVAYRGGNIEYIHNLIHNLISGSNGTMFYANFAAFDPIFWLHHAQVDRLVAIWQALNPLYAIVPQSNILGNYYQPRGAVESANSVLAPFHSDDVVGMFTPESVRNMSLFGYTYPELRDLNDSSNETLALLRNRINSLYNQGIAKHRIKLRRKVKHSTSFANAFQHITLSEALEFGINNLETQWSILVEVKCTTKFQGLAVDFFVGQPPREVSKWSTAANHIGTFAQFGPIASSSENSSRSPLFTAQGEIFLTHVLVVAISSGFLLDMSSNEVVPLLKAHLHWRVRNKHNREIRTEELPEITLLVVSRKVKRSVKENEFPSYGEYTAFLEVTEGKAGERKAST